MAVAGVAVLVGVETVGETGQAGKLASGSESIEISEAPSSRDSALVFAFHKWMPKTRSSFR
jgi:hypothetical protein